VVHRSPPQPVPPPRLFYSQINPPNILREFEFRNRNELLFAPDLDVNFPAAGPVELTEIYSLPCTKHQRFVFYKNLLAAADERAFTMRIGIAFGVSITGAALWKQLLQSQKDIMRDRWVGVFIYRYRRRRVGTVNYHVSVDDAGLLDQRTHLARDVYHLVAASRIYAKIFPDNLHFTLAPSLNVMKFL